jgi:DeoR family fructose operon transcriptional repressor
VISLLIEVHDVLRSQRHNGIIDWLRREEVARVSDMAQAFGVAESTIRRDLDELEKLGMVKREYGGASLSKRMVSEPSFQERQILHRAEKEAVGRMASTLVLDGETIFIDGGTTTEFMIPHIMDRKGLTVVTCGLNITMQLLGSPHVSTIVVGGLVDPASKALIPFQLEDISQLRDIRVSKSFVSAGGVSALFGVTNRLMDRIPTKKKSIEIASETIVMVDGSKVGAVAVGIVAPMMAVDTLVTDISAPEAELEAIKELGVRLVLAEVENSDAGP